MAPKVCRKTQLVPFWEVTPKIGFHFYAEENLWAKGSQKLLGQVWGNSAKNPSHPQNFACSYTYGASICSENDLNTNNHINRS